MNLPNWWFLAAYLTGGAWILAWELIAAWVDRDEGDTITEITRALVHSAPLWFVLAGLLAWLVDHLLLDDALTHAIQSLRRRAG